jgi:uncharacterized protein YbgA (DUF1722 family)/uncharacterized protein YbbK (DUF523 family)
MTIDSDLVAYPRPPLPVAVSECLTGSGVRFDGGHKHSSMPHEQCDALFEWRPLCPEVAIGLGVPRDSIRLEGGPDRPRAVNTSGEDFSARLERYGQEVVPVLADVDGYVFMKNSPSCGLHRVKVYPGGDRPPRHEGRGVYAAAVVEALPQLPVEEGGRLFDPVLLENFVTRVFAHAHWRALVVAGISARRLIAFHSAWKHLVMAHSVPAYQRLGRRLADLSGPLDGIAAEYFAGLMAGLARPATRGGHANVLSHLQGYVKTALDAPARRELADLIESYRRGELPLMAPLALLRHHLREHGAAYALNQLYLEPHPSGSGLRRDL